MPKKADRQPNDLRPEAQQGEEHGSIKKAQLTDRHMPEPDLARGSEPEVNGRR